MADIDNYTSLNIDAEISEPSKEHVYTEIQLGVEYINCGDDGKTTIRNFADTGNYTSLITETKTNEPGISKQPTENVYNDLDIVPDRVSRCTPRVFGIVIFISLIVIGSAITAIYYFVIKDANEIDGKPSQIEEATPTSSTSTTGAANCTFPNALNGAWTSTNFGTITISNSTPHFTMDTVFTGSTATNTTFDCHLTSGTTYILKSINTITVFSGTDTKYIYMCFDLHADNENAAYYYLNTATEVGLSGLRLAGFSPTTVITNETEVCTETLDTAEYNTMVKNGYENAAIDSELCMDILLGTFRYTYTDSTGTYCPGVNTSTISSCDSQNLTTIFVNNTGCTTKHPFFSTSGTVGCLFTIPTTSTSTFFTTVYNLDTTVDDSTTYRLTCVAATTDNNGTINLSLTPTVCASGQTSTTLPTGGALMVLTTESIPTTTVASAYDWTWLIILMVVLAVLIIVVIILICCFYHYKKKQKREKAREKKILLTEDHPLGEMSMSLDAPASMEREYEAIVETRNGTSRTPRSKKKDTMTNPLGETSMNLDFKGRSWESFGTVTLSDIDPFTEMDNGIVVPISPQGSKATRSMRNSKQKSFHYSNGGPKANGHVRNILPITDGRTEVPIQEEGNMTDRSIKAPSLKAYSVKAPSISARSVKAPSVTSAAVPRAKSRAGANEGSIKAESVKALSVKAPSTKRSKTGSLKLKRSATSTRIGSVTRRLKSSRSNVLRSQTMILPDKSAEDSKKDQEMTDFMNGEITNFDGAVSEAGKSKKSARSTKSKSKSSTTPRRSILKKHSAFSSSKEFLTEEEIFAQMANEVNYLPPDDTAIVDAYMARESYLSVKQKTDLALSSSMKKPSASKGPWK